MQCCLLEHYLQAAQRVVDGRWRQSLSAKLEYPVFDVPGGDLRKPFVLEVWEHVVREVPPHNDEVRLDQLVSAGDPALLDFFLCPSPGRRLAGHPRAAPGQQLFVVATEPGVVEPSVSARGGTHRRTQRAFPREPLRNSCPEEDLNLHTIAGTRP
jgi:hypothetical protein